MSSFAIPRIDPVKPTNRNGYLANAVSVSKVRCVDGIEKNGNEHVII